MGSRDHSYMAAARRHRTQEAKGATLRIYGVKKDGTRYARPTYGRDVLFTLEEALKKIDELARLNPRHRYVVE